MTGIVLDSVLMLLLVAALAYGVRLEKKLTALRAGQMAFAGAVTELNAAAGRAEAALGSLRVAGEEADMLHDRILKARAVKQELEMLIARGDRRPLPPPAGEGGRSEAKTGWGRPGEPDSEGLRVVEPSPPGRSATTLPGSGREKIVPSDAADDRALRMAALAERIHGMASPKSAPAPGRDSVSAIMSALTANHAPQHSPNRPARSLDDDLFAA